MHGPGNVPWAPRARPVALALALGLCLAPGLQGQPGAPKPADGFTWSETTGWIDTAPEWGGVFVYPDYLAGFAWSESCGWIQLGSDGGGPYANTGPTDWGVNRSASGQLAGFAWSETIGWIRFDPAFGGVRIDPFSGVFEGFAWSETIGWIHVRNRDPEYGPAIELAVVEVPTLGQTGLLLLASILVAAGLVLLRRT